MAEQAATVLLVPPTPKKDSDEVSYVPVTHKENSESEVLSDEKNEQCFTIL